MSNRWFDSSRQIFWDNNQQDLTIPGFLTGTSGTFDSLTIPNLLAVPSPNQIGTNLTAVTSIPSGGGWNSIAISATGQYQSAINTANNAIYISNNYGNTWISNTDSGLSLTTIAMSGSGQYQSAVGYDNIGFSGYYIYTSSNYGVLWNYSSIPPLANMYVIRISDSGQYQTTVAYGEYMYTSSDFGSTWNTVDTPRGWADIAISSSGQYQTATVSNVTGIVYKSSNYGVTWISVSVNTGQTNRYVAISATGQYQIVIADGTNNIYLSNDFGITWNSTATDRKSVV